MRLKKPFLLLAVPALLMTSACGEASSSAAPSQFKERVLVHTTFIPESHPSSVQVLDWMDEVTKRTNGAVTFEKNFSAALCPAVDSLDCVSDGRADLGSITPALAPTRLPTANLDSLPFQISSPQAFGNTWAEFFRDDVIEGEFKSAGVKMIYGTPLASFVLGTTEPIQDVSELNGKTIRSLGQLGKSLDALGADVIATGAEEIYEALQRGVVDGYTITPDAVASYKLQEVTNYFYDLGALTGASTIQAYGINLNVWNDLEPELQEIMLAAGNDIASRAMVDYFNPYVATACKEMVAASNGFFPISDKTGWAAQMKKKMFEDYLQNTKGVDKDAAERYKALLAKMADKIGDDYKATGKICLDVAQERSKS